MYYIWRVKLIQKVNKNKSLTAIIPRVQTKTAIHIIITITIIVLLRKRRFRGDTAGKI